MKQKGALYVQLDSLKKPVLVFYLVTAAVAALAILGYRMGWEVQVNNLQMISMIFLFVVGCCSFREDFLFLMQNGVSRGAIFQTHCLAYGLLCLLMALLDTLLGALLAAFGPGKSLMDSYLPGLTGPARLLADGGLLLSAYLFLLSFGYLLGVLSYRGGRGVTVLLAVGIPVLALGTPVFLSLETELSRSLLSAVLRLIHSFPALTASLFALAVLFHAIGGLLERRAPVRTRGSAAA